MSLIAEIEAALAAMDSADVKTAMDARCDVDEHAPRWLRALLAALRERDELLLEAGEAVVKCLPSGKALALKARIRATLERGGK